MPIGAAYKLWEFIITEQISGFFEKKVCIVVYLYVTKHLRYSLKAPWHMNMYHGLKVEGEFRL